MKLNVKNFTVVGAAIFSITGSSLTVHADVVTSIIDNTDRNEHSFDEIDRPPKTGVRPSRVSTGNYSKF